MEESVIDYIKHLEAKIDLLTDMVEKLAMSKPRSYQQKIMQRPECSQCFDEWLSQITVNEDHIQVVFQTNIADGFKSVIESHRKKCDFPLYYEKRKLYVYIQQDEETPSWIQFTEQHFRILITNVWQKMIRVFLKMTPDPEMTNESWDWNTKKIMSMRYQLCDPEKPRKQLIKWLTEIL